MNEARKESRKPYMIALVNGKEEPLQSFTLEPEGIYPGRPGSPDAGLWKEAVNLKEVVVNSNTKTPMLMQNDNLIEFDFKREWDGKNHYAARYPVRVGVVPEETDEGSDEGTEEYYQFLRTRNIHDIEVGGKLDVRRHIRKYA